MAFLPDPWLRCAIGALAGLIVGSFLATLAIRWPAGRSIAAGRSRCDQCDATLRARELVPLLSYLLQHGRCRHCAQPIDRSHPSIELCAALIGGASLLVDPGWPGLAGTIAGWLLLTLAVLDVAHLWLPDRLTLPFVGFGLVAAMATGRPSIVDSAIGAIGGWAALAGIAAAYRAVRGRTGIGGGDPKLFAGIGAWLGWQALPFVLLAAALLGLFAILVLHLRGRTLARTTMLPLGALLAAAAWPIWLAGLVP